MTDNPQANSPEIIAVAGLVWTCCICCLVEGVQVYKKRKSWVNFLILRNASGNLIGQSINLFGMCLGLLDGVLALKMFFILCYLGSCFHLLLSLYRFQIFGALLPRCLLRFIQINFFVPFVGTICVICWIPMIIHLTSELPFATSTWFFLWAVSAFFIWMFVWVVIDNIVTLHSLRLVLKIKKGIANQGLSKDQVYCRNVCILTLGILFISDIIAWPEMTFAAIDAIRLGTLRSHGLRRIVSLGGSLMVFHISISFVYMHYIFRLITSKTDLNLELGTNVIAFDRTSGNKSGGNTHSKSERDTTNSNCDVEKGVQLKDPFEMTRVTTPMQVKQTKIPVMENGADCEAGTFPVNHTDGEVGN